VSVSVIQHRLTSAAGIISAGVLHIKDQGKIGTMYCSKGTQLSKLANYFFSRKSRRIGCDQMKLIKTNCDKMTSMGGNHTSWQLQDVRQLQWSHSAGGII